MLLVGSLLLLLRVASRPAARGTTGVPASDGRQCGPPSAGGGTHGDGIRRNGRSSCQWWIAAAPTGGSTRVGGTRRHRHCETVAAVAALQARGPPQTPRRGCRKAPTRRRCGAECWRARQMQRRSRSRVARLVARRRVQWHRCGQRICVRRQEWGAVSTATSFVSAKTFSPWLRGAAVRDARQFFRRGARTRGGRLTRTRGVDVHCFSLCQQHHYALRPRAFVCKSV